MKTIVLPLCAAMMCLVFFDANSLGADADAKRQPQHDWLDSSARLDYCRGCL